MKNAFRRLSVSTLSVCLAMVTALAGQTASAAEHEMLYLVEFEANIAGAPTSPEQAIGLLSEVIVPSLEMLAEDKRIRAGGLLVGARGGAFIVTAESHDEVTELVHALPAWGVWDWTVTPLESFSNRVDVEKETVENLRKR